MPILDLPFEEVCERVATVEVRISIGRGAVGISTVVVGEVTAGSAEIIILNNSIGGRIGGGLVIHGALSEDAELDCVLAPDLGEVVAHVGLNLLQLQRIVAVVGPQAERKAAIGRISPELWILSISVVERTVIRIADGALLQGRELPCIEGLREGSNRQIELVGHGRGED